MTQPGKVYKIRRNETCQVISGEYFSLNNTPEERMPMNVQNKPHSIANSHTESSHRSTMAKLQIMSMNANSITGKLNLIQAYVHYDEPVLIAV